MNSPLPSLRCGAKLSMLILVVLSLTQVARSLAHNLFPFINEVKGSFKYAYAMRPGNKRTTASRSDAEYGRE